MIEKRVLGVMVLAFFLIVLIGNVGAVCCEKTNNGGICVDVGSADYCNRNFRIDDTACESTEHCSTGTCVNNKEGTCTVSTSAACNPSLGGYFVNDKPENINDCAYGCCLIGDGAAYVGRVTCNAMAATYGVDSDFRPAVADEATCLANAGPTVKGACVSQTDKGRGCTMETREECNSQDKEFHAGLLCSAPQLGTICTMTERTICVEGKNEVYFVDDCGNPANVYDASKIDDVAYWTEIKEPEESCNAGESNVNSADCGNCNYLFGSTCGEGTASHGDYICRDLGCVDKDGARREHGESWCSQPIADFENAKPGDLSYLLYCYDGEVQWELCGNERTGLCKEDNPGEANCIPNRWQACAFQNDSNGCLDTDKRDCRIEYTSLTNSSRDSILFLDSNTGSRIKATCVPKYPPGFNFWKSDTAILGVRPVLTPSQVCGFASANAAAGYTVGLFTNWRAVEEKCFAKCITDCEDWLEALKGTCQQACFAKDCKDSESFASTDYGGGGGKNLEMVDLNGTWVTGQQGLCKSFGDCGVKPNYFGGDSYNAWKDFFVGANISIENIPGANSHQ
jgi:hypothetical protein